MGFENLMLQETGFPNVPDAKALERKITELETHLRSAQLDAERNRGEAVLYRHVRTLSAREFSSLYTRNISGHGRMDDLIEQSLRKSMEKKS